MIWIIFIFAVVAFFYFKGGQPTPPILPRNTETPETLQSFAPIAPADFQMANLTAPSINSPQVKCTWMSVGHDQKALSEHVVYLNGFKANAQAAGERVFKRFSEDQKAVESQRNRVVQNIFRTRALAQRFAEVANVRSSTSFNTSRFSLALPAKPAVKSPKDFEKTYFPDAQPLGRAIGRMATNKNISGSATVGALVIGLAIHAVKAKKSVLEGKRIVDEWHGLVSEFALNVRQSAELLAKAHAELVLFSVRLSAAQDEICQIARKIQMMPPECSQLDKLNPDERAALQTLIWWSMAAEQVSSQSI